MTSNKNEAGTLLPIEVTQGVVVDVLPDDRNEFLLTTSNVAKGYGVSEYAVQKCKTRNPSDLVEGKHFVTARTICPSEPTIPHNKIFWTKRGIVRLGFFIKSQQARLFRDWAEELILSSKDTHTVALRPKNPSGRRINRLTPARVADILADVCMVRDDALRERLAAKIKGGVDYGC